MAAAISFKINDDYKIFIYAAGTHEKIDWESGDLCLLGSKYRIFPFKTNVKPVDLNPVQISKGLDEQPVLRLIETKRYMLKVKSENDSIELPHFQNEGNKLLKCERDSDSITFQYVNYLGRTRIFSPKTFDNTTLVFEIVPDKMHYEEDYVALTEDLAEHCTELLFEFSGATSNVFRQNKTVSANIFEQFIFLRKFCYSGNLRSLFEAIKRNPDRMLLQENVLKPYGLGAPSKKFYSNPFAYGKKWRSLEKSPAGNFYALPSKIAVTRKADSFDTTANRFLRFALKRFDSVCTEIIVKSKEKRLKYLAQCVMEAESMHSMILDILRDRFFEEIGDLQMMPLNNQVLQKRDGYSQIFTASLMMDLALQLDWKGQNDIYEGESKNVAQLYEYWLFFELYKVIKSIPGCVSVQTDEDFAFLQNKDALTVSLKQGKKSCQYFVANKFDTKINLYYNRTFSYKDFQTTEYAGSYSRDFRPDYTLAVFPASFDGGELNGEKKAVAAGAVNYIHFDAKYRVTDLTSIIGKTNDSEQTGNPDDDSVKSEKTEAILNTYKRGDLLKMHTYNDAIRQTAGSYVLYPGSDSYSINDSVKFHLYDEILPGVGAFAIKPGISKMCETVLKDFIVSVIQANNQRQSRMNRMNYYSGMVLNEPAVQYINENSRPEMHQSKVLQNNKETCVAGYIRPDYYYALKRIKLLDPGKIFTFYFYAIKDNAVYSHHKDIFSTKYFRFYTNNINSDGYYHLLNFKCRILSNELVSKKELVRKLIKEGCETGEKKHHADYYYTITVQVLTDDIPEVKLLKEQIDSQNGNDSFSPHSPKIINL